MSDSAIGSPLASGTALDGVRLAEKGVVSHFQEAVNKKAGSCANTGCLGAECNEAKLKYLNIRLSIIQNSLHPALGGNR